MKRKTKFVYFLCNMYSRGKDDNKAGNFTIIYNTIEDNFMYTPIPQGQTV